MHEEEKSIAQTVFSLGVGTAASIKYAGRHMFDGPSRSKQSESSRRGNQRSWANSFRGVTQGPISREHADWNALVSKRNLDKHRLRIVRNGYGFRTLDQLKGAVFSGQIELSPPELAAFNRRYPDVAI